MATFSPGYQVFTDGDDEKYFSGLHKVLDFLYGQAGIGPFPEWPTFINEDFDEFLAKINKNSNKAHQN